MLLQLKDDIVCLCVCKYQFELKFKPRDLVLQKYKYTWQKVSLSGCPAQTEASAFVNPLGPSNNPTQPSRTRRKWNSTATATIDRQTVGGPH